MLSRACQYLRVRANDCQRKTAEATIITLSLLPCFLCLIACLFCLVYGIEAARGNDHTCSAQGFLIQMGTITALFNASLATYYFLRVHKNWSESKFLEIRHWLFICPILIGLVFASVGFLYYGMVFTWCTNTAKWWPEIPVILAIIVTTILYSIMFYGAYRTYQAMNIYAHGGGQGQTSAVFRQSCWYLVPFYLTWVPYVALQYTWASRRGYSRYGFAVTASTLVPLQGFWNCVVYIRNSSRLRAKLQKITTRIQHNVRETTARISSWLHSMYHSVVALRAGDAGSDLAEDAPGDER